MHLYGLTNPTEALTAMKHAVFGEKGYTVSDLAPLAIVFVVLAITVGMGALILSEMKNQTDAGSTAESVITKGIDAMSSFGDWFGILVVVVIAAVIIGIVLRYFGGLGAKTPEA